MQLKMYTTTWCAYCKAEKQFLTDKGVKFTEVDVESDPEAANEMYKLSGQTGVPFTVITKEDGQRLGILGFDRPRLTEVLGLTR
jgi:glutaredoxin-like YruB-family protein